MKRFLGCALMLFFLTSVMGCWYAAAAGAGAYGGYKAKEQIIVKGKVAYLESFGGYYITG